MATVLADPKHLAMADLKGKVDPDWCPGCGDFGVLAAVQNGSLDQALRIARIVGNRGRRCRPLRSGLLGR